MMEKDGTLFIGPDVGDRVLVDGKGALRLVLSVDAERRTVRVSTHYDGPGDECTWDRLWYPGHGWVFR